jgi:hypothetical protein
MVESKIVIFRLNVEPRFYLASLGVEEIPKNMVGCDPSADLNTSNSSRILLSEAALAFELNVLVDNFKLEILSLVPSGGETLVYARTVMFKQFKYNFRRFYQRQVSGDLCPRCLEDVTFPSEKCSKCHGKIVWLTGGAIASS